MKVVIVGLLVGILVVASAIFWVQVREREDRERRAAAIELAREREKAAIRESEERNRASARQAAEAEAQLEKTFGH